MVWKGKEEHIPRYFRRKFIEWGEMLTNKAQI